MSWTIYYNPKCGSCRKAQQILKENQIEPRVVEYLKTPLTLGELQDVARKLGNQWPAMVRTKEPIFEELGLDDSNPSQVRLLKAIIEHPILLQRPIVIHDDRAVVARPPELLEDLF